MGAGARLRRNKLDSGRKVKKAQLNRIYRRDRAMCFWCWRYVPRIDASREHLIALSLGGSRYDCNVVLAHKECNR